jgi:hypothetical protein
MFPFSLPCRTARLNQQAKPRWKTVVLKNKKLNNCYSSAWFIPAPCRQKLAKVPRLLGRKKNHRNCENLSHSAQSSVFSSPLKRSSKVLDPHQQLIEFN